MATDFGTLVWPAAVSTNPSVGTNGSTAPGSSTEVGGVGVDGNLHPIAVTNAGVIITTPDPSGVQHVIVDSSALPTGAATSALQTTGNSALGSILLDLTNGTQITQITGTVPLPTGAATSALQTTGNTSLSSIDTKTPALVSGSVPVHVDNFPATQPVSGTVSIGGPLGQQAAASSVSVALANEDVQDLAVTGQSAQTATVNNILTVASGTAATDLIGYRSFSVQVVSTGTGGTFIFEGSNDNTSFVAVPVFNQLILTGAPIVASIGATASQIIYQGAAHYRYLRLRIATTITGGSIQAFSKFSTQSFAPSVNEVAQATAANLNATVTATNLSTNIAQINAVTPLMGNGVTGTGSLRVTLASDTTSNTNPLLFAQAGYAKSNNPVTIASYSAANVTTAAYTQLVASTTSATKQIQIFDSSGQAMIIATGAAASEVDQIYVPPGGGIFNLAIAAATRVSIKALTATANSGYFLIDFLG